MGKTTSDGQAAPATLTAGRLLAVVALALLATAAVLAGVLTLVNRADWWRGFAAASIASLLGAAAAVVPVLLTLRRSMQALVAGHFASALLRAAVSLGACLLAVHAGDWPRRPTLLLMVPYYFAGMAAEATLVGRHLWNAKA